ncbi:c-type cytochrome [Rhizobium oryzicola]|uniref:Cytochrome c n=1 Tax=Rhizobium oryzicola TaxID=1232668 RepID=A0ABT8SYJ5_9HYPH|nr:cytochrome c [Rhizobium oryzicola]MDO1583426.1 cytochrome c [Rhizobium oryzicola]
MTHPPLKRSPISKTRKTLVGLGAVAGIGVVGAGLFFAWPHSLPAVTPSANLPKGDALLERGRYLATAADCVACHTTKGGKFFAGGLAFKLPFGTIYSSNITPDAEYGIGSWSDEEFVRAMRSGIGQHGENLYPAFPYTSYALLSTDDILAIRAYLRSLAPVSAPSPANELAFPFNQRWLMRGWNLLFLASGPMQQNPSKNEKWNRGAYLVEALAHCGECHTPRGLMFQRVQSEALSGGEVDGWKAWNITSDPDSGLGKWTDEELTALLSTGHAKGHGPAGGGMREAIDLSLSKLPKSDIEAIVAYLRTVPPVKTDPAIRVETKPAEARAAETAAAGSGKLSTGAEIFAGACASCHGKDGSGLANARAGITGAHALSDPQGSNLIRVILNGSSDGSGAPGKTMPGFAAIYSDTEVAALANYMIGTFGGKKGTVTAKAVEGARE